MAPPTFAELGLDPRLVSSLEERGYEEPTPIQAKAIPPLLEGRDLIGRARTGSGKTAAFGLPLLQRLKERGEEGKGPPGALVLAPTRELALQVSAALESYGEPLGVRCLTVYGGASYGPQLRGLERGVGVVVGTPGRLIDLLERGSLDLSALRLLVIDEADEMLRMGFIEEVEKIVQASPEDRQVALFSATMPPPIRRIADGYLREPAVVEVEEEALSAAHIHQRGMLVPQRFKLEALLRVLATEERDGTLIFTRTKVASAELAEALAARGFAAEALHGDLSQAARERVLALLVEGRIDILVATDVAARGLDVERLSHVINMDLPNDPESYVHRIGRTGRAGREGAAISFATPSERGQMRTLERALGAPIEVMLAPTDRQVRARAEARLRGLLDKALEAPAPALIELASRIFAESLPDRSPSELLAAALEIVATREGLSFHGEASDRPPAWSRPPSSGRERPPRDGRPGERRDGGRDRDRDGGPSSGRGEDARAIADQAELFLPVGKARGVRAKDLVGALTHQLGVPAGLIGQIRIGTNKSLVRVAEEVAGRLLEEHPWLPIHGKKVPLFRARPDSGPEAGGPPRGRGGRPPEGGWGKAHRGPPSPHASKRKGKRGNR